MASARAGMQGSTQPSHMLLGARRVLQRIARGALGSRLDGPEGCLGEEKQGGAGGARGKGHFRGGLGEALGPLGVTASRWGNPFGSSAFPESAMFLLTGLRAGNAPRRHSEYGGSVSAAWHLGMNTWGASCDVGRAAFDMDKMSH